MRVAGIRLRDGRTIWADAGDMDLAVLDRAEIRGPVGGETGVVCVIPEHMTGMPPRIDGQVVDVQPHTAPDDDCGAVRGAEMPPLGSTLSAGQNKGVVIAVDAVRGQVTLRGEDGRDVVESYTTGK